MKKVPLGFASSVINFNRGPWLKAVAAGQCQTETSDFSAE